MFLYTRVVALSQSMLLMAYRSNLTLKEICNNILNVFFRLVYYFWINCRNILIFLKYVWDLREFDRPKRMIVIQWYNTIKKINDAYYENLLVYQKQLQRDNIYELSIVHEIECSPDSMDIDFNTPFFTMSFVIALFTIIRFIPFFAILNIFLKSFYI